MHSGTYIKKTSDGDYEYGYLHQKIHVLGYYYGYSFSCMEYCHDGPPTQEKLGNFPSYKEACEWQDRQKV